MTRLQTAIVGALLAPVLVQSLSDAAPAFTTAQFFSWFWNNRPTIRLGTRGEVCAIAPRVVGQRTVWNDRPMLVWQGNPQQINLLDAANMPLAPVNKADQYAAYTGKPLQPGSPYQWQIVGGNTQSPAYWMTFRVMPSEQRDRISADLKAIEQKSKSAAPEDLALQKAEYFAKQNLWTDALQTLHEVKNPSQNFVQQRRSYVADLCGKRPANT